MYGMVLMKQAKLKLGIQGSEVTLKQVTHFCDALSGEGGKGGTMGHFRESSYAYLFFLNGTILTTITFTTSIDKGKSTTATINTKQKSTLILPVTYKVEGISASRRARELWELRGQIGVELNFQSTALCEKPL